MTMKTAIVSRSALTAALTTVRDVVERKNSIPILSNVRLVASNGQLLVTGTDLDVITTATVPAGAIDDAFDITIPAYAALDILKKAPAGDDLAIDASPLDADKPEGEDMTAGLDFGDLRITMHGLHSKDFPQIPMSEPVREFEVSTAGFRDSLKRVEFAISPEETRYYLNGIYMHVQNAGNTSRLVMVTTDGHRLARHDMSTADGSPVPDFGGVLVPRKTVAHLLKVTGQKGAPETMRVIVNHQKIRFVVGNIDVVSKLIDGTFPDYRRVIPSANDKAATFDKAALIEALKAVGTVASERGRAVKLEIESGNCRLTVNNPDMGKAAMDIVTTYPAGDFGGFEIGFNRDYMLHILAATDGDVVTLRFNDSSSPTVIHAGAEAFDRDAGTFCILMPMRV
jgi:DNA polymerase III subunit beta